MNNNQVEIMRTLAYLNMGQQLIINAGLLSIVGLATMDVMSGALPVGNVVAVNALVLQLAQPLNFMGGAYRLVQQGVIDL